LGWLDRLVKERLRVKGYVRYMDDVALWGDSTAELGVWLGKVREFLARQLNLDLKASPYVNRVGHGMDFLGCRVSQSHLALNRRSRRRFRRKLVALESAFESGEMTESELQPRATALVAFTTAGGVSSFQFRRRVLQQLAVSGQKARTA
jgi:hypothetical protein